MNNYQPGHRIIIITGNYGAGKTNVAVNIAKQLAGDGKKTAMLDFDIVNPYFRAADNEKELTELGVRCIIPEYANSNVDVPSLPPEVNSVFCNPDEYAVFDVGGDDSGATALAYCAAKIEKEGYDMLCVINMYRPLIADPKDAVQMIRDIEKNSRLKCTGLINNSNLGTETTPETVTDSLEYAAEVSRLSGLPLIFTSGIGDNAPKDGFRMTGATKKLF